MSELPLLISVPHAGIRVPEEASGLCLLDRAQLVRDSDEGAAEIYLPLREHVPALVTTPIARSIVDVNRAADDWRPNGALKKRTFQRERIWRKKPDLALARRLIERYWRPYHRALARLAERARLGVDCHVMSAFGPPVAGDAGVERPLVCVGVADGTCPESWTARLLACLERAFGAEVSLNAPFPGGYITRSRPGGLPWVQLELSSAEWLSTADKHRRVRQALQAFCRDLLDPE